jgi:hypothetical protein
VKPGAAITAKVFSGTFSKSENAITRDRLADSEGVVTVKLTAAGAWYVKFVHMRERSDAGANYESLWNTLRFGLN